MIEIKGNKYKGIFRSQLKKTKDWRGSEYTEHQIDVYWYEGAGIIEDKKTKERYFFVFKTDSFEEMYASKRDEWLKENYSLEESIINFNQKSKFNLFKPKITDGGKYKRIVDLCFGDMVSQVKASEEELPQIMPKKLKLEKLVEFGFCAEENGQIAISLAKVNKAEMFCSY